MKCSFAGGVVDGIQASFADYFEFASYHIRPAPVQGLPECRITPIIPNNHRLLIATCALISRMRLRPALLTPQVIV
jgi:hypothetical protein